MNSKVGSHIGAIIGSVVHVEVDFAGNGWEKFLRVLVEVNCYKLLIHGTMLSLPGSRIFNSFPTSTSTMCLLFLWGPSA